jgi:hypothetical protein
MTPCNQRRLRVSARRVEMDSSMDDDDFPSSSSPAPPVSSLAASGIDTTQGPGAVAAGITQLFTHLVINLSGVEISKPQLALFRAPVPAATAARPAPGQPASPMLLQIAMSVKILELPPLNMQF